MPRRSAFDAMPKADFEQFSEEFANRAFKDLDGMCAWLEVRGYEIKRGSVWRTGAKLKRKLQAIKDATTAARLVVESAQDDESSLGEAVIAMVQSQMFDVMTNLAEAGDEEDPAERVKLLSNAARASADAARAAIATKKHRLDLQSKAQAAANTVSKLAKKGGISAEVIRQIEEQILGIAK